MKIKHLLFTTLLTSTIFAYGNPIDLDKAQKIAEKFASSSGGFKLAYKSVSKKGVTNEKNSPLYIFNRGNNEGFVIVSGDDCLPEILGYTESGCYNPDSLPALLLDWIENYSMMIETAQENKIPPHIKKRNSIQKQSIKPLITAHWNQGYPYNILCPIIKGTNNRAVTGCVATAGSQIAYYWKNDIPTRTQIDTPTYDEGDAPVTESIPAGTPYRWELIRDIHDNSTPNDMNLAVANLMSVIGTTTKLNYGYTTLGGIPRLIDTFRDQFNISSSFIYKDTVSQENWEKYIYEDLIMNRPVVYGGIKPGYGGHVVVIDGYDANNNLYHFDFGWGGSGNGYFTVNDINGMNGFSEWQNMACGIHPINNNLTGRINTDVLYTDMQNNIEVEITNHSVGAYKGIYVFISEEQKKPTDLNNATIKNISDIILPNNTVKYNYKYHTDNSKETIYIYITDNNLIVLDSAEVRIEEQNTEYYLESWKANGYYDGNKYNIYRDNDADLVVSLSLPEDCTPGYPELETIIYKLDTNENSYKEYIRKSVSGVCNSGEITEFTFQINGLEKGAQYKAKITPNIIGTENIINTNEINTEIEFMIMGKSLTHNRPSEYMLDIEGNWDKKVFEDIINSYEDSIASVDLRKVNNIYDTLSINKKNILYYINEKTNINGINIIKNGICDKLVLNSEYNFVPIGNFFAKEATLYVTPKDHTKWMYLTIPFNCKLPEGVIAREITSLKGVNIDGIKNITDSILAGIPYLVKFSTKDKYCFNSKNVEVTNENNGKNENICISYINKRNNRKYRVLNDEINQKFTLTSSDIYAFTGFLDYNYDVNVRISNLVSKDNALTLLSNTIENAIMTYEEFKNYIEQENVNDFLNKITNAKKIYSSQCEIDSLTLANEELTENIEDFKNSIVLLDNIVDITNVVLKNPSFETKRTTGWNIKKTIGQFTVISSLSAKLDNYMINVDKDCYFNTYSNTNKGGAEISQEVENIPNGYYRVEAMVAGKENVEITLFANDSNKTCIVNDMGDRYFNKIVIDSVYINNSKITIGCRSNNNYKADNFRLIYQGKNDVTSVENNVNKYKENIQIWSEEKSIIIKSEKETRVKIYSINGLLIKDFICHGYAKVNGIPKGLYIINNKKIYIN